MILLNQNDYFCGPKIFYILKQKNIHDKNNYIQRTEENQG